VNLLGNSIAAEQAQELVKTMRSKKNLTTLCGLSREETELDFSGQDLGAGDAVLIANDISDMGALIELDISSNYIEAEQKEGLQRICVASGIDLAM
jgi:Ran GTPase-activating protein (RanGAP) involved in mRNA processing and transport